jgi:hypothetical protein
MYEMLAELPGVGEFAAQVVTQLGVAGVLGWYLWYHTSREAPRQREAFLTAIQGVGERAVQIEQNARQAYLESLNRMVDRYINLGQRQAEGSEKVREGLDTLTDLIRDLIDQRQARGPGGLAG